MTSIDPYAHRAKALEAAASPQFAMAGIVHAIVYLGDQLARLVDLATAVASQPAEDTTPDGGLGAATLHAMPIGATVADTDGNVWNRTEYGWAVDGLPSYHVTNAQLIDRYGPITPC